jgi:peptidoglycan-associated lipoprotein
MIKRFALLFVAACALAACESDVASDRSGTSGDASGRGGAGVSTTGAGGGRPGAPRPGSREEFQVSVGDRVYFDTDRYDLRPDARATLEKQAQWLKQYGNVRVQVEGHADERGTREYNLALGDRRAAAVKNYLVALGIPAGRINTISYGKERPVDPRSSEDAYAQNRRGVTSITDGVVGALPSPGTSG